MGKLINRIPGLCLLISSLQGSASGTHVESLCQQAFSKPCLVNLISKATHLAFSIFLQELDIIYKVPHCVPISAHHKWNFDDLLEKMWEYLQLARM